MGNSDHGMNLQEIQTAGGSVERSSTRKNRLPHGGLQPYFESQRAKIKLTFRPSLLHFADSGRLEICIVYRVGEVVYRIERWPAPARNPPQHPRSPHRPAPWNWSHSFCPQNWSHLLCPAPTRSSPQLRSSPHRPSKRNWSHLLGPAPMHRPKSPQTSWSYWF